MFWKQLKIKIIYFRGVGPFAKNLKCYSWVINRTPV